jgi:hypothetical protein
MGIAGSGHQDPVEFADKIEIKTPRTAGLPDHSKAVVQRTDIGKGCGGIIREAVDGTGRLIFEELRQVCPGALDLRGQNGLPAFQASRDEVRVREELRNSRCGGNRFFRGQQRLHD